MTSPTYLTTSTRGIYYLRFPIPTILHPEAKQSAIRLSLETRCPHEALHLSRGLSYSGNQLLRTPEISHMDYHQIREILFDHFKAMRERMKQRIETTGRLTDLDKKALLNNKQRVVTALATNDFSEVGTDSELSHIIDDYALPINPQSDQYGVLRTEFLKAFRDYCDSVIEYDSRFEGYNFKTDPQSLAMQQAAKRASRKKLADVLEIYVDEKLRLEKWKEGTAKDVRRHFDWLFRYLGEDVPLNITDDVAKDVKAMLFRMPSHIGKYNKLKDMSIEEIANQKGHELLGSVTVSKYLGSYSSFYHWAIKRKETKENPFDGLIDDTSNVALQRDKFTPEQSRLIIDTALEASKPHHKWGTLLAFYTGARLNEIAQLDIADIKQMDDIWCIDINENNEQKSLKNKSSRRVIPIHSQLIEWGFIDYVKSVNKPRLFPALTYSVDNGYGRNLGRWFNATLLPKLDLKSETLVFHSIRHTVANQLRNNEVEHTTIKEVLGHAQDDITIDVYANKLRISVMQKAVETIAY